MGAAEQDLPGLPDPGGGQEPLLGGAGRHPGQPHLYHRLPDLRRTGRTGRTDGDQRRAAHAAAGLQRLHRLLWHRHCHPGQRQPHRLHFCLHPVRLPEHHGDHHGPSAGPEHPGQHHRADRGHRDDLRHYLLRPPGLYGKPKREAADEKGWCISDVESSDPGDHDEYAPAAGGPGRGIRRAHRYDDLRH